MSKITFQKNKKDKQSQKDYIAEAQKRKFFSNEIANKLSSAINLLNDANNLQFNQDDYSLNKYYKQAEALLGCCTRFFSEEWKSEKLDDTKRKTKPFRTCKNKFCSICAKIRSNKLFHDTYNVIKHIKDNELVEFIPYHLTLTIKNPLYKDFDHYYHVMNEALHDFLDNKQKSKIYKLNKYVLGWQCAREVSQSPEAKGRGELHPHLHILLLLSTDFVNKLNRSNKINKDKILIEWNNALKSQDPEFPETTQIEFVKIKQSKNNNDIIDNEANAIAEVSKYPIKPEDAIAMDDFVLFDLMKSLENKRMITFGGIIKQVRKELKYKDDVVVDAFIHQDEYKLVNVKLYNYDKTKSIYKKQNIKKSDLLEYRTLSSTELIELNYSKDKDKVIYRSPAVRQYLHNDFNSINQISTIAKYKDFENIKDSDTGLICSELLKLADDDYKQSIKIKQFNQIYAIISIYLQIYKTILLS